MIHLLHYETESQTDHFYLISVFMTLIIFNIGSLLVVKSIYYFISKYTVACIFFVRVLDSLGIGPSVLTAPINPYVSIYSL